MSLEQDIKSVEIEYNLTGAVTDYAMYTELGNAAVHGVVTAARQSNASWAQVYQWLQTLAEQEQFAEATDTMVREYVYDALNYNSNEQPFYGA